MNFKSIVSDLPLLKVKNIAVVCHDAGAANIIIASLLDTGRNDWRAYMRGPAEKLWKAAFPGVALCDTLDSTLDGAELVITGTGWGSDVEHEARKLARTRGIRSVAVIDHWVNYRARFVRGGEEVLPDEIWVIDEYAKKLAEIEFPGVRVVQLQNLYLENLVREVREHEHGEIISPIGNILYVLEPIRHSWGVNELPGEFQALDYFVMNLETLQLNGNVPIKLRPHPSDAVGKYDQWIKSQNGLKISLDESSTLAESIAWSDVVVGCQTYAMVVALAAGRRVISSVPSWAPSCILPQAGILKLADLVH